MCLEGPRKRSRKEDVSGVKTQVDNGVSQILTCFWTVRKEPLVLKGFAYFYGVQKPRNSLQNTTEL